MKDAEKTKEQLMTELEELRQRIAELEAAEIEHKQAEEELQKSEERFSKAFNLNPSPTSITKVEDGRFFAVNESFLRVLGFKREEVIGHTPLELNLYVDHNERAKVLDTLDKEKRASQPEIKIRSKSGEVLIMRFAAEQLELDYEECIIVTAVDMTEERLAEEALRESEERYRSLFKNNHSVMLLIDPESAEIVDANPAACSFYGWSLEELTSKKITDINMLTNEQVFQEIERAKSEERNHFFFRHRLMNEEILDVEVYSGPIRLHDKELLYSIIHDISERKRAEEELRKAHHGLEQRTAELVKLNEKLRKREAELEIQTSELEEVNTALRVLLKRGNEGKIEIEERTLSNVKQLVLPYVARLKSSGLDAKQVTYVNILESNLNDIVSPFSRRLSSTYLGLTPTEIQIANLVKEGKTTKEMAEMLHSSPRTVEFHRNKIREKIGIKNSKANLRSHLLSM